MTRSTVRASVENLIGNIKKFLGRPVGLNRIAIQLQGLP